MNIMAWLFALMIWVNGATAQGCQYDLATGTLVCSPHVRQTAPPQRIFATAPMPSRQKGGN